MNRPLTILTGASRGMGLAMAMQLADAGHELLCISRKSSDELAARAKAKGVPIEQWTQDLSRPDTVAGLLATWLAARKPETIATLTLINNAALVPPIAPLGDIGAAALSDAMRVNLEAPMLLTRAFLHASAAWTMPRRILNISSGLGRRAMASQAAYCASKAGMDHFSRCVALEEALKPNGARICSLAPGVIDTDMQVQLRAADPARFPDVGSFQGLKDKGQLSSPHDAAARVLAYLGRPDFGANPAADVRDA